MHWRYRRTRSVRLWKILHTQHYLLRAFRLADGGGCGRKPGGSQSHTRAGESGRWARSSRRLFRFSPADGHRQAILAVRKGCTSAVWGCERFWLYLFGSRFQLVNDNLAVQLIFGPYWSLGAQSPSIRLRHRSSRRQVQHGGLSITPTRPMAIASCKNNSILVGMFFLIHKIKFLFIFKYFSQETLQRFGIPLSHMKILIDLMKYNDLIYKNTKGNKPVIEANHFLGFFLFDQYLNV